MSLRRTRFRGNMWTGSSKAFRPNRGNSNLSRRACGAWRNSIPRGPPSIVTGMTRAMNVGRFPLQLVTNHPPYSFHTQTDGKNSHVSMLDDHRLEVDGYRYRVLKIGQADAGARGLKHGDLVRVHNERASVICAADVSPMMMEGVVRGSESSRSRSHSEPGWTCRPRRLSRPPDSLAPNNQDRGRIMPNSCWVEVEKWDKGQERAA